MEYGMWNVEVEISNFGTFAARMARANFRLFPTVVSDLILPKMQFLVFESHPWDNS